MNSSFKQPKALFVLCLTEAWERFGFYIMQAMLVLYMIKAFSLDDNKSYAILGATMALAYVGPIVGGYLADKLIGYKMAVVIGGILLMLGYAILVVPADFFLYWGLGSIIAGNSLLKPNISTLLGTFYEGDHDPRREAGFTIFYIGINMGALLSMLSGGFIARWLGWGAVFGMASIGLALGMFTFLFGWKKMAGHGLAPKLKKAGHTFFSMSTNQLVFIVGIVASITAFSFLVMYNKLTDELFIVLSIAVLFALSRLAVKEDKLQRNKLFLMLFLLVTSAIFWSLFFQLFFSDTLFIERLVQRNFLGAIIPTPVFSALESIYLVMVGWVFACLWKFLEKKGHNLEPQYKFAVAFFFIALGFLSMIEGMRQTPIMEKVNLIWVILAYLFVTLGELFLSPIGLSAITVLSPPRLVGMMMGIWFATLGLGGELAGVIAKIAAVPKDVVDPAILRPIYQQAFGVYAILAVGVGIIALALSPYFGRLMRDKTG